MRAEYDCRQLLCGSICLAFCRWSTVDSITATETTTVVLEQVPHPAMMWVSMGLFAVVGWCVYDILPYPAATVLGIVCVAWLLMIFGFWLDRGRSLKKLVAALSDLPEE